MCPGPPPPAAATPGRARRASMAAARAVCVIESVLASVCVRPPPPPRTTNHTLNTRARSSCHVPTSKKRYFVVKDLLAHCIVKRPLGALGPPACESHSSLAT